jgi:predicted ATPase
MENNTTICRITAVGNVSRLIHALHRLNAEGSPIKEVVCQEIVDRGSSSSVYLKGISDGMSELSTVLKDASRDYDVNFSLSFEDKANDNAGMITYREGLVRNRLTYTYTVHVYKESGVDAVYDIARERFLDGVSFEDFMSESGLWAFIGRDDKELLEQNYKQL